MATTKDYKEFIVSQLSILNISIPNIGGKIGFVHFSDITTVLLLLSKRFLKK